MKIFIWTEAYNCGEILQPMLDSYLKHHDIPINVFGTKEDLSLLKTESKLVIPRQVNDKNFFGISVESRILSGYKSGHIGTARLWEYLINSRSEEILVHIDADTIFIGESVSDLIHSVAIEGFAIAGSRRTYRNRGYRKTGIDGKLLNLRPDVVNTDCFAFNLSYIRKRPKFLLRRKILGRRSSLLPVVDFFDPVTFEILSKGGKIKYMDSPKNGFHSTINPDSKFLQSRISFAAVGSGCNFFKYGYTGIPEGYALYALQSYSLFAREFLNKKIDITPLNDESILKKLMRLDKENWVLKN